MKRLSHIIVGLIAAVATFFLAQECQNTESTSQTYYDTLEVTRFIDTVLVAHTYDTTINYYSKSATRVDTVYVERADSLPGLIARPLNVYTSRLAVKFGYANYTVRTTGELYDISIKLNQDLPVVNTTERVTVERVDKRASYTPLLGLSNNGPLAGVQIEKGRFRYLALGGKSQGLFFVGFNLKRKWKEP